MWARQTAADLRRRAPLSLAVTLNHIRWAKDQDLRGVLQGDYRLACHFLEDHDFYEGVRAVVIEKDNAPQWRPSRIEDATASMTERYLSQPSGPAWHLPTRAEMQAARA